MKNFFADIFKKLISTILFAVIMLALSYCIITGEFPPKIANMKKSFQDMRAQIEQLKKIQESQLAKLSASVDQINEQKMTNDAEIKYHQALLEKIKELEARIARLESKSQ